MLPLTSGIQGSSGENLHYPSTMNLYLNETKQTDGDLAVIAIIAIEVQSWQKTIILASRELWSSSIYRMNLSEGQYFLRNSMWMSAIHRNLSFTILWRCLRFRAIWVREEVPGRWVDEVDCVVYVAFFVIKWALRLITHWLLNMKNFHYLGKMTGLIISKSQLFTQ